jgi:hypothetical protein
MSYTQPLGDAAHFGFGGTYTQPLGNAAHFDFDGGSSGPLLTPRLPLVVIAGAVQELGYANPLLGVGGLLFCKAAGSSSTMRLLTTEQKAPFVKADGSSWSNIRLVVDAM